VAVPLATAVAAARRRRARPSPPAPVPPLPGRVRTVPADDGVALHVEEHGPSGAVATAPDRPGPRWSQVARAVRRVMPWAYERLAREEACGKVRRVTPLERRLVLGRGADPLHVREVLQVQAACTAETMPAFLTTFDTQDRLAVLALAGRPVAV